MNMNRRSFFSRLVALGGAAVVAPLVAPKAVAVAEPADSSTYTIKPLPPGSYTPQELAKAIAERIVFDDPRFG